MLSYKVQRHEASSILTSHISTVTDIIVPLLAVEASTSSSTSFYSATTGLTSVSDSVSSPSGIHGTRRTTIIVATVLPCVFLAALSFFLARHLIRNRRRQRHELNKDMSFLPRDGFGAASRSSPSRPSSAGGATNPPRNSGSRPSTGGGKPLPLLDSRRPSITEKPPAAFLIPPKASNASLRRESAQSDKSMLSSPTSATSHPFGALTSPTEVRPHADAWVISPTREAGHERQPSYTHRRTMRLLKALADQERRRPDSEAAADSAAPAVPPKDIPPSQAAEP